MKLTRAMMAGLLDVESGRHWSNCMKRATASALYRRGLFIASTDYKFHISDTGRAVVLACKSLGHTAAELRGE